MIVWHVLNNCTSGTLVQVGMIYCRNDCLALSITSPGVRVINVGMIYCRNDCLAQYALKYYGGIRQVGMIYCRNDCLARQD